MIEALLYANIFVNVMALSFVFFGAAKPHVFAEDPLIRFGAMVACFGLLGQAVRNTQYFLTGVSPADADLPFWMLKDVGLVIMILGYAVRGPVGETFTKRG